MLSKYAVFISVLCVSGLQKIRTVELATVSLPVDTDVPVI